jgi:hypothetical protein
MFIPHEVKEKVENLELEVKKLKAENADLKNTELTPEKKNKSAAPVILGVLLIASIALNVYFFKFYNAPASTEDNTAYMDSVSFYMDGQIVKMSTMPTEGMVYRVQIGAYLENDLNEYIQNLDGISQDTLNGFTKISLAGFSSVTEAQSFQEEMVNMGLGTAYIVAYNKGEPVGILPPQPRELTNDSI